MNRSYAWHPLLALLALATISACDSLPLLAPSDSMITVVANPPVVPLEGESTITAVVTEPAGTAAQDGTLVTFSTTLGTLDPQEALTRDGRASVRLLAGKTAGTASVSAFSGTSTSNTLSVLIASSLSP